ncbi:MAG: adenylyltransferase [Candidatus Marinimicrobia bacterium]|nr:adenylyltransferase [Candidatus Neomarinimicrobiota bacterium]
MDKSMTETKKLIKSITLTERQICDIELILDGSFKPLTGFMIKKDYMSVLDQMRLSNGNLWPMPIILDLSKESIDSIKNKNKIELRDQEGFLIAEMDIEDIWKPDKEKEAEKVFGTTSEEHPGVKQLNNLKEYYVGGKLEKINNPIHHDFQKLRLSPNEVKKEIAKLKYSQTIAFQTRNPIHRAHQELMIRSMDELNANILIHPVVGMTKPGDFNHYTRVNCYKKILPYFPKKSTLLSLIPLAMRMAGPREALWHAIIRKNYGCSHLIVGRDHAGPGSNSEGNPFYGPYDAQELLSKHQDEIGIKMLPFKLFVFVEEKNDFYEFDKIPSGHKSKNISGTELRKKIINGEEIPDWFTYPEITQELRKIYPPKEQQGFTLFFTGLSGSGKSTVANALMAKLLELQDRKVTLLDGDIVRTHLSSELGFSKEHRNLNITRIGFVASEITKNGGIAICAPIAPYESPRIANREIISKGGNYIEVHISTPLETCEKRDVKGLYAKARAGIIKGFTGIDDPYEPPKNPEITIDTSNISVTNAVDHLISYLKNKELL